MGEPARDRLDGPEPAFCELGAAVGGRLCVQLRDFDVGAFQGPGLDDRQEVLYFPWPYARSFKVIGQTALCARLPVRAQ
ncbi:hypothetical protein [Streptomyces sp. NPDC059893]|uniref:hypothetical protein n=1 Tax=Streptomyces sp. NPDC059893 TaxID=3346990 RepID=UPI00365D19CA